MARHLKKLASDEALSCSCANRSQCELLERKTAVQNQLFSSLDETSENDEYFLGESYSLPRMYQSSEQSEDELQMRDSIRKAKTRHRGVEEKARTHVRFCEVNKGLQASNEECKAMRNLKQLRNEGERKILQNKISNRRKSKKSLSHRNRHSRSFSVPSSRCGSPGSSIPCDSCSPFNFSVKNQLIQDTAFSHQKAKLYFTVLQDYKRLKAEACLKKFICDTEMVHKLIYLAVVESFRAAKEAFQCVRSQVIEILAGHSCRGPEALESECMNYIACCKDLFDVNYAVQKVRCTPEPQHVSKINVA